jgi:hypothetical protein
VTAELQTSAYSFFASIQNWLNDFSLKLRWNRWSDIISMRWSWLFPDKFALEIASILSGEQIQSVLPSETAVKKGKYDSNSTLILSKWAKMCFCVYRLRVLSSFCSMKSVNVQNVV